MTSTQTYRFAAEWEDQDAVLIAWPHARTDWADMLEEVERVYLDLARQVTRFESLVVASPEPAVVSAKLQAAGIDPDRVLFLQTRTNDTWARDFGPLTVFRDRQPVLLDFIFNGWGNKFVADHDNRVTFALEHSGLTGTAERKESQLVLEGGSVETDGEGTLLTTSACLLNKNRNPELTQKQLEEKLSGYLGVDHFLWLDHGWLAGDDTDAHIDTLARLCPASTILYVACDRPDDRHYPELKRMEEQLGTFTTKQGRPYQLLPLPWPRARYDGPERLPATYANYLVINNAVLVPTYDDPADERAIRTIERAFPGREVIGIDCLPLIRQHGSLHCITMQLPKGVLA